MKNNKAFTLVELLVVIVVIGILASIATVAYSGIQVRARDSIREQDVSSITKALELYYLDKGHYPTSHNNGELINSGWSTSVEAEAWDGLAAHLSDYVSGLPVDPRNTHTPGVHSSTHLDTEFHYAYFATDNNFCGKSNDWNTSRLRPQMYMLVYQYEGRAQKTKLVGDCPPTTLTYDHASYIRTVR